MSLWRIGVAVVFAIASLVALANVAIHHSPIWIPLAFYAAIVCALALFERNRYVTSHAATPSRAIATAETFFDPTTGKRTRVFYDAATGSREYR